uniref:Uncharacterized protein LOC123615412 isoform X2 n=1 Tax=Camelus bactrianus TaxID=9837 RepID=A0A9W3HDI2_CAMBA|nr:uncharacterized protein LOC123615412 isoform X2 [Camelus bactrianus]
MPGRSPGQAQPADGRAFRVAHGSPNREEGGRLAGRPGPGRAEMDGTPQGSIQDLGQREAGAHSPLVQSPPSADTVSRRQRRSSRPRPRLLWARLPEGTASPSHSLTGAHTLKTTQSFTRNLLDAGCREHKGSSPPARPPSAPENRRAVGDSLPPLHPDRQGWAPLLTHCTPQPHRW